jgi:hypothetical protein
MNKFGLLHETLFSDYKPQQQRETISLQFPFLPKFYLNMKQIKFLHTLNYNLIYTQLVLEQTRMLN